MAAGADACLRCFRRSECEAPVASVVVIGGGLAGLSAAAALGGAGHQVQLLESRPSWRASHFLRSRRRNHRQLPAHPAALLRQSPRFL
ncbi:MAG: FAD-dependent oxidoreductase [Acidobacteriota bacterium]